jgi:dipeptidyl aminopeptidase/acylaminoacyl peptidase
MSEKNKVTMNLPKTFRFATCLVAMIMMIPSCQEEDRVRKLTAEDYKTAARFMSLDWYNKVENQIGGMNWTGSDFLIYDKQTSAGKEYVLVDLATKEKSDAFDRERLANALNEKEEGDYDPKDLPLRDIRFEASSGLISFKVGATSYQCNLSDYRLIELSADLRSPRPNEHVSPNGKLAAFIQDHNLWVRNLETNQSTQLTFDGQKDYGYATDNAGWTRSDRAVLRWSPNSDKIATFQQDARGVGEMFLTSTNVGHPTLEAWKYPLPGDNTIFTIERVIIHVDQPKVVRLKRGKEFQRGTTTDHITNRSGELLDAQWSADGSQFAFVTGSRDHKVAELQVANANTGAVRSVYRETVDTYYESANNAAQGPPDGPLYWSILFDSDEFIWFSENTNWRHLYLHNLTSGAVKNAITEGEWATQQIMFIDEEHREIYFTVGGRDEGNPYYHYLYKANFDGSNLKNLTPELGAHRFAFSPDKQFIVDTYSTVDAPPVSVLRDREGNILMELEQANIDALQAEGWQAPIEFRVKARDNETDLYGVVVLPTHYDENKSYPVLNYLYPGPQSGSVGNYGFRPVWRDFQAVAELGFVVVAVDAMGTPGRSKAFHDFYYGNMGDNGVPDNMAAIKQLAKTYKGMDLDRVGIWGHSGGGFASTRAILAYPDFYKVAVSSSGNHENRNYEADWGEKWQGLLVENKIEGKEDGTTNYDNQANLLLAENLQGKLMLAHGSMDNNVPPSNTMLMVDALIKANKDFDLLIFPNKRHGYGDMNPYFTRKRWDYWVKHLLNAEPPKEVSLEIF